MQEIWVWSLGWEDPLEKEMATHSSIRAWEIPRTEEPGGLQTGVVEEFDMSSWLNNSASSFCPMKMGPLLCHKNDLLEAHTCWDHWLHCLFLINKTPTSQPSFYWQSSNCVPGTVLYPLPILIHLIHIILCNRYYYYPHFRNNESHSEPSGNIFWMNG